MCGDNSVLTHEVNFSVSSDVKKLSRSLDQKFKRQIPFITSVALNSTMFERARLFKRPSLNSSIDRHHSRPRRFKSKSLKEKIDLSRGICLQDFWEDLPAGWESLPLNTCAVDQRRNSETVQHNIAVPATKRDQNKYGSLKRGQVRRLLSNTAKYFHWSSKRESFMGFCIVGAHGKGGRKSIRKRVIFIDQAKYEPIFPFEESGSRILVKKKFSKNFKSAFLESNKLKSDSQNIIFL